MLSVSTRFLCTFLVLIILFDGPNTSNDAGELRALCHVTVIPEVILCRRQLCIYLVKAIVCKTGTKHLSASLDLSRREEKK